MAEVMEDTAPLIDDDAPMSPSGADAPKAAEVAKAPAEAPKAAPEAKAAPDKVVAPDKAAEVKVEPTAWGEDWRDKVAKGDAKKLSRLGRYASPEAVVDALIAAQNRISSGDLKPTLKKDATPEQI